MPPAILGLILLPTFKKAELKFTGSFNILVLFAPQLSRVKEQQFFMNCNFAVHGCL